MMKGNEKDCICEKPKGKHRKHCDAYRLSEFQKKVVVTLEPVELLDNFDYSHGTPVEWRSRRDGD